MPLTFSPEVVPHRGVPVEQSAERRALVSVDGPGEPEHCGMVLEVLAHPRQVMSHWNLETMAVTYVFRRGRREKQRLCLKFYYRDKR